MDQLEKIRRQYWKEHLKMVFREQGYSFTKLRKFTDVCMVGGTNWPAGGGGAETCLPSPPPPHHTNFCEISRI